MAKRPNNMGTITKLSGKRQYPFAARLPAVVKWDEKSQQASVVRKLLGTYETRAKAWAALQEYKAKSPELFLPERKQLFTSPPTLIDIYERWTNSLSFTKLSHSTQGNYTAVWNKYISKIKNTPITEIKTSTLQDLIDSMVDVKSGTKKNTVKVMRSLMNIAISDDLISRNYADFVNYEVDEVEITREIFTSDEIKIISSNISNWLCQILFIMVYSGMRIKEVINITVNDVNLSERSIYIPVGKNKFAKRYIPIHSEIFPLIEQLCSSHTDKIITDELGKSLSDNRVYSCQENIKDITGKEHYVYDAKHTFITECVRINMPELYKVAIIGHTPKSISGKHYTHLTVEDLRTQLERVKY